MKASTLTNRLLCADDRLMQLAALYIGFFGFLRASEYLSLSWTSSSARQMLQHKDLELVNGKLRIMIRVSKTDQTGRGYCFEISPSGGSTCSIAVMEAYLVARV